VDEVVDLLCRTATCQGLDRDDVRVLAGVGSIRLAREGDDLMREGEPGSSMALLVDGQVRILKAGSDGDLRELAVVGAGTLLGEMALLESAPRTATVRAATPVRYLEIERAAFESLLDTQSRSAAHVILAIARTLSRRQRETNDRLVKLLADASAADAGACLQGQVIEVDF
jgi:CRP-like cAMP-binding protein